MMLARAGTLVCLKASDLNNLHLPLILLPFLSCQYLLHCHLVVRLFKDQVLLVQGMFLHRT